MVYTVRQGQSWGQVYGTIADNVQPVLRMLGMLLKPGEVIELRLVEIRRDNDATHVRYPANGYFDNPIKLAETVAYCDGKADMIGFTVNPVRPELLRAANNKVRRPAGWTAAERDVLRRATLPISFDSNVQDAIDRACACHEFLSAQGWPDPVLARNCNQAQLLYAVDLPNSSESTELTKRVLDVINIRFCDELVQLDPCSSQAALLCPVYGALSSREDGKRSAIWHLPDQLRPVAPALLRALTGLTVDGSCPDKDRQDGVDGSLTHQFVRALCELKRESWLPTGVLYSAYQVFCYEHGLPVTSVPHFARRLVSEFDLEPERRKVRGVVTRGIRGIRLRQD